MEGLQPLHRRVAGIDVHLMLHVACVLVEQADGLGMPRRRTAGVRTRLLDNTTRPPQRLPP